MDGEEISLLRVLSTVEPACPCRRPGSQAIGEGDAGPNTGGMGAYSPAPVMDAGDGRRVMAEIVRPTIDGMAAEGAP